MSKILQQTEKRIFSDMPLVSKISSKKALQNFGENIDKIYDINTQPQFNEIAKLIYTKLSIDDLEQGWIPEIYSAFKKFFATITIEKIDIIGASIQKCLSTTRTEINQELKRFSQECKWYQVMINKKETTNNNDEVEIRGIHSTDCFYIIASLLSYMYKAIHVFANEFVATTMEEDSLVDILNKFKTDKEIQQNFQLRFEEEFQFLTKYTLFVDVYQNMKTKCLYEVEETIRKNCGSKKVAKDYRTLTMCGASSTAKYLGTNQIKWDI